MRKYLFIMANEGHRWGGSEPLWSSAAEKLVRCGNEVRVSVKDWGGPVPQIEYLRSIGCKIFYRRPPSFIRRQIRKIFPVAEYWLGHIKSLGGAVDLIVISESDNVDGLVWMEAARAAGCRYAVIAQSAVVYWWPPDDVVDRLSESYEKSSGAFFVSQATLNLSRWQFGGPLQHGKVVRNPFNVRYDACPRWPSDRSGALMLACVGRLDVVSKAQDVLLAVLGLPHWRERNIRLSLIGEGPHERVLRRLTEQLRLTNVSFLGQSVDIENVWAKHHALVLPSRFEGMPLVVVEAMLCNRPCIVTDVGGNSELVRDGTNGFLAKAPTVPLLDEAMNRAWDNLDRLEEIGYSAGQDVRRWVSADPGQDFARELAALAGDNLEERRER